jgi:hypothetical protein
MVGRKASGATAWRPDPAVDAARVLCTRRAQGAWSPRAGQRGGALAGGPVAASQWQGLGLEHHDYVADVPGKESGGGAHRCGGATVGQSCSSARRCPRRREGQR